MYDNHVYNHTVLTGATLTHCTTITHLTHRITLSDRVLFYYIGLTYKAMGLKFMYMVTTLTLTPFATVTTVIHRVILESRSN